MKIGFLVSSNIRYEAALNRLLASMAYISPSQILVVVGGCDFEGSISKDGIVHRFVSHNSFDHTACIDLIFPADWTHVFLLHDTMELTPESYDMIAYADPSADATAVWNGQCNLMLLRADYLLSKREELNKFRNCSKMEAVVSEGWLWKVAPDARHYPDNTYTNGETVTTYDGVPRLREFYDAVHIIKWKANWMIQEIMPTSL